MTWRGPSPLEAAIWYAERGLPVLPCHWPTSERGGGHWAGITCSCGHPACSNPARPPILPGDVARASADPRQVRRCDGLDWTDRRSLGADPSNAALPGRPDRP